jgi:hypothetical protein
LSTLKVTNIQATGETATRAVSGVAAAWVNANGQGTVAIRDSMNVASLTDYGTGRYGVNLSNAFGAVDYSISATATWNAGFTASTNTSIDGDPVGKPTTTQFRTYNYVTASDAIYDPEFVFASTHGDLA